MQRTSTNCTVRAVLAGLITTFGLGGLGVVTAAPRAGAVSEATAGALGPLTLSRVSSDRPNVTANDQVPQPSWWEGTCDDERPGANPQSKPLGASWDGLVACGPGTNEGGINSAVQFYPGAWGEYEWQCVELSMRWMYLAWGVPPYPADGNQIVDSYAQYNPRGPQLTVVKNGTKGVAPQPGDVLELTDGDADGHTEVVTASAVNSEGNGTVTVMTENLNAPTNGWDTLPVSDWVVDGGFGTVVDWLHNPAWSLQEPIVSELTATGDLFVKFGAIRGALTEVASDVAQAEVIGGGGSEPAPMLVVLTDSGVVEASYELPGAPWWTIGTGATQIAATSGEGPTGEPTIGWLTAKGDFYVRSGGFSSPPVLEATGASSIAIGSDSPASEGLIGYVTPSTRAFLKVGSGAFAQIASGVRTLELAGDGGDNAASLVGYVGVQGRAFLRTGLTGPFAEIGPTAARSVSQLALATVGPSATPLVAYLTSTGSAYAEYGDNGFVHELSDASGVVVAGGHNPGAFPIFGVEETDGQWFVKDATLSSAYASEGTAVSLGVGALVVS